MAERYKKVDFSSFKDGQGFEYAGDHTGYKAATNVTIDEQTGKLSLGNALTAISVPAPVDTLAAQGSSVVLASSFIIAGYDSAGAVTKLYKSTTGTSISLIKTLSVTFNNYAGMIGNGKMAIIFSSSATNRFAYSVDEGATWTESTQTLFDQYRASNVTLGEYTYFVGHLVGGNYAIIRTRDGQSFETVYQAPSSALVLTYIVEADGAIYFIMGSNAYKLENGNAVLIKKFKAEEDLNLYSNGNLYLLSTKGSGAGNPTRIRLYEFDGIRFILTKNFLFNDEVQAQGYGTRDINSAYIVAKVVNGDYNGFSMIVFRIDQDGALHLFQAFNYGNEEVWEAFIFNSKIYYVDGGAVTPQLLYANNYVLSGYVETGTIDKGEIIPKELILRHEPLTSAMSMKVYIKKDFAAAWTLLLTSDTVSAIKKKYIFPNNSGISDFIELKVELITSGNTVTPKFISLAFLYLPVGLEQSA